MMTDRSSEPAGEAPPPVTIRGKHTALDYLFFTRPVLMPPVWTVALLGAAVVSERIVPWYEWGLLFVQLWCLFGAVYTLNQICDIESDRANRKLYFLPEGMITVPHAWYFTAALNVVALALAFRVGLAYAALTATIALLGVVYSVGKHPWKDNPVLGLLANAVAHGSVVYLMGVVWAGGLLAEHWSRSLPYALAVGGVYLATTVADIPGDRVAGKQTIGVVFGGRMTMILAALCLAGTVIAATAMDDWPLLLAAGLALPIYGWAAGGDTERRGPRAARWGVAALTLVSLLYFPSYLIWLCFGFFGTRAFFHWRFNMTYPSFG